MVRGYVEQHCHIAVEAVGEIDLVARQLEDIDPALGQRVLLQNRQADVAAHRGRHARGLEDMVGERGGGGLAVGAGDADHLVRRQPGARLREQLDVADYRHREFRRVPGDGVGVERHPGADDDACVAGEVGLQ